MFGYKKILEEVMVVHRTQSTRFQMYDLPKELKQSVFTEVIQGTPSAQRCQLLAALRDTKAIEIEKLSKIPIV